jgi:hypothetical protein
VFQPWDVVNPCMCLSGFWLSPPVQGYSIKYGIQGEPEGLCVCVGGTCSGSDYAGTGLYS